MNHDAMSRIELLSQQLESTPPANVDEFLLQLPDAGLIHATTGRFPKAWLDLAQSLLHTETDTAHASELDRSLSSLLEMLADMIDQGCGEFLALGISQLQLATLAFEGLDDVFQASENSDRTIQNSVFQSLEELEIVSAATPLDEEAAMHLEAWKNQLPDLPEYLMIPAISEVLNAEQLQQHLVLNQMVHRNLSAGDSTGTQAAPSIISVDFAGATTQQAGTWKPRAALAAFSRDDDGDRWDLIPANVEQAIGTLFTDGEGFWSFELDLNLPVKHIFLDQTSMQQEEDNPHSWEATLMTHEIPHRVEVIHGEEDVIRLVFDRKPPSENTYR